MQDIYKVETHPLALSENMITGDKYRITFLTEGLIRLEYDEEGVFEDRPTQMVFFRDFPKADYRVVRTEDGIEVHTKRIHLIYNEKEFTSWGLSIQVKGNLSAYHSIWHYGEEIHDLKGTARAGAWYSFQVRIFSGGRQQIAGASAGRLDRAKKKGHQGSVLLRIRT